MKKQIAASILGILPVLSLAAGNHAGGHETGHEHGTPAAGRQQPGGDHDRGHRHGSGHHDMGQMHGAMHGTGIGRPGDPAKVSRTIEVTMDDDMRFAPSSIQVKAGETIRFFVRNRGKQAHEFVLGTMAELKEHAAMMRAQPHMKHNEPNMVSLGAGKLGGLVWQFDQSGTIDFACLVPGHFEAGMVGKIQVE